MSAGFGLENLPYGVVAPRGGGEPRGAVRLGEEAIDLAALQAAGLLPDAPPFAAPTLNGLLAAGRPLWRALRGRLVALLGDGAGAVPAAARLPLADCAVLLPVEVGDYVDFYSSLEHATNVARILRPDTEPLAPNWRVLPVAYHGRASTVVVSGTPVRRPCGLRPDFGPTRMLDVELELAFVTGGALNAPGEPLDIAAAAEHIFGFVLLNDWSARDVQAFEYRPLGPFLGKSFATSISPWIVPLDALAPYRVAGPPQWPEPAAYLRSGEPWALDLDLSIEIEDTVVSRASARGLYWSAAQQLAHAAVNGTALRPGDLYGSGTISGPERGSEGCLLELTRGGREPLTLADGSSRSFLEDGDTVTLRAATPDGLVSFGELVGTVLPALPPRD